jgi:NAD(P)-dependent dehydrogenase (short-subunit alcohol dehydrogenase family)
VYPRRPMGPRVVVITGASAGIGASLAELLSKKGDHVVLAARRERELGEVAARCGANALPVVTDVTIRGDVTKTLAHAIARFGHLDAWVNNAGRGISRAPSEITDEDFDDMMLVNAKAPLFAIQAVLPHFKERRRGHIVNVSSMLGRMPLATVRAMYSASKHALNALTASLRIELRATFPDIHVSTVSPGVVATDFGLNAKHGGFDSRNLPGAQPVDEVAAVIADVLDRPRADAYTRPGGREMVAAYYAAEDMGAAEQAPPFMGTPARRA